MTDLSLHTETEKLCYEHVSDMIMAMMGVDQFAYIKPQLAGEGEHYTVFAADGTALDTHECMEDAFESIQRYNLLAVQLH